MIFTNLALNNIGPYRGKHEFNLKPEVDGVNSKPVILFGGLAPELQLGKLLFLAYI